MTMTVMTSATASGRVHQLMEKASSQNTMGEQKQGVATRQIWNANVTTVSTGWRRQFTVAKGMIQ
jgi:translation initiation factor RLI1